MNYRKMFFDRPRHIFFNGIQKCLDTRAGVACVRAWVSAEDNIR